MTTAFSRYQPVMERTFALRTFNEHETEMNRHYWSFKVVSDYSNFIARERESQDPQQLTSRVFNASGPDASRIPRTVSAWIGASKDLENWLRLSALVSATSYLETYLRQVLRSALMSDPACRFGASLALDGTKLLKSGIEPEFDQDIEAITRGDWPGRCAKFKAMFGSVPLALTSNLARLEKVRKMRNEFAHGFGRGLDIPAPSQRSTRVSSRISEQRLTQDLGIISKVAASVDRLLLTNNIGNFEPIHFYHGWRSSSRPKADLGYGPDRAFQRALKREANVNVGAVFCRELVKYYDAV
jgi:hypothetical protein